MIRTLLLDADGHACLGGEELIAHWLGVMLSLVAGMLYLFRRKRWL
ncbi:hypothetical protein [Halomonas caseinilytica]|nr:hypothetical protein [Halomonas caseinilytica]